MEAESLWGAKLQGCAPEEGLLEQKGALHSQLSSPLAPVHVLPADLLAQSLLATKELCVKCLGELPCSCL